MSIAAPLLVAVAGEAQRATMIAAAELFSASLGSALGEQIMVRLQLIGPDDPPAAGVAILVSLVEEVESSTPVQEVAAVWRARIDRWRELGLARILVCSIFRGADPHLAERIRGLNLMILELSRDLGVEIVDVDRLFGLCGARWLGAGHRGDSAAAAGIAGHAIVAALFNGDLTGVDADLQQRAAALHGDANDIDALMTRFAAGTMA